MDIYSWDKGSQISSMAVKQAISGPEAVLYPAEMLRGSKLMHIPDSLRKAGLDAEPFLAEGNKPALRIRGFDSPEQVLDILAKDGHGRPADHQSVNTTGLAAAAKAPADLAAPPSASKGTGRAI